MKVRANSQVAGVHEVPQVDVPVGVRAAQWVTVRPERTVLVIAHNVTTLTRLLDALPAFDSDPRVQVIASWSGSDPFQHGLRELVAALGIITIPWEQVRQTRFDLAISASHHGGLTDINAPLVILSHGIGYTKYSPGNRKPETGNRKPETGNRQVFGLSPQWVLYDGQPFASALVLSHEEQLARLRAAAPAAAPVAVIAGDPCFDRILVSRESRDQYRNALGVAGRRLIMLSSTWWSGSLLGSWPDLARRLLAELPADSYQVAAALHPNIWHGHGPWQIRAWLGDCLRSGLVLLSEVNGWRAGMIAADLVLGDHGSVTGYSAAVGRPVMLAAFADDDVAAGSPIARLGELAPRLDPTVSLLRQVEDTIAGHTPARYADVTNAVTSFPGEALVRLRELFYRLMALPEPDLEPPLEPVPAKSLTDDPVARADAMRVEYTVDVDARMVRLRRYPAETARRSPAGVSDGGVDVHLACPSNYLMRTVRNAAAVLTGQAGEPDTWFADTLGRHPTCRVVALLDENRATVRVRDSVRLEVRCRTAPESALPSAIHAWLTTGVSVPSRLALRLGDSTHTVDITVQDPGQPRRSPANDR